MRFLILLAGAAIAFGVDLAHWVTERGGAIQTDAKARNTGVNLGFNWVTDADVEMLTGLTTAPSSTSRSSIGWRYSTSPKPR